MTIRRGNGDLDKATNHRHGGAIHNHGSLFIFNSTVSDSLAPTGWGGGGITNAGPTPIGGTTLPSARLVLQNVTVAKNFSYLRGGGIENGGGLQAINTTVSANKAPSNQGGGIFNVGSAVLENTIVAKNATFDASGAFANVGDCAGTLTSQTHNLDSDGTCKLAAPGDQSGVDPGFEGELLADDGLIFVYPLLAASRAIDAGDNSICPTLDERGVSRPQDGNGDGTAVCDIGAYEHRAAPAGGGTGAAEDTPAVSTGGGNKVTDPPSKKQIAQQGSGGSSGGGGSAGGGTQQATIAGLDVIAPKRFAFGRLRKGRRSLLLGFESQGPGRLELVLKRGAKTLARGGATVTGAGDFGYRLRLPTKLRPGSLRLRVSFTPSGGERSTKTFRIKFVPKRAPR